MDFNVNIGEVAGIAAFTTAATHLISKVTATFGPWVVSSRLALLVGSVATTVAILANKLFGSSKYDSASRQATTLVGSSLLGSVAGLATWNFFSATATPNLFAAKTVVLFTTLIALGQLGVKAARSAAEDVKAKQATAV